MCLVISRNCLPFACTWVLSRFLVQSMLLIFLVLCVVFFCALFVFVLCRMFPVYLDCLFLIAPSVCSNVYIDLVLPPRDTTSIVYVLHLRYTTHIKDGKESLWILQTFIEIRNSIKTSSNERNSLSTHYDLQSDIPYCFRIMICPPHIRYITGQINGLNPWKPSLVSTQQIH